MAPPTSSEHLEAYKQQAMRDFRHAHSFLSDKREEVTSLYLEPAVDFLSASIQRAPIATTFFALLTALSFIPVATFSVFALSTIVLVGGGALLTAAAVVSWIVGSAALLLVGALVVTVSISAFLTAGLVATYLALRFLSILRNADTLPAAVKQFQEELSNLYVGRAWQIKEETSSNGSNGAANKKVRIDGVVKQEGAADTAVKVD
ncbi:hypothetical protein JCM8097_004055 [Rhodosporidiobolus ruineniae]